MSPKQADQQSAHATVVSLGAAATGLAVVILAPHIGVPWLAVTAIGALGSTLGGSVASLIYRWPFIKTEKQTEAAAKALAFDRVKSLQWDEAVNQLKKQIKELRALNKESADAITLEEEVRQILLAGPHEWHLQKLALGDKPRPRLLHDRS